MFSGAPDALGYDVVLADGTVDEIDLHEHLAAVRLDASLERVLPGRVCTVTPEARAVVVHRLVGEPEQPSCR